jgi:hypothetical protein
MRGGAGAEDAGDLGEGEEVVVVVEVAEGVEEDIRAGEGVVAEGEMAHVGAGAGAAVLGGDHGEELCGVVDAECGGAGLAEGDEVAAVAAADVEDGAGGGEDAAERGDVGVGVEFLAEGALV